MDYYRNIETGRVHAFDSDGSAAAFIGDNMIKLTAVEVEQHLNPTPPELTQAEVEALRLRAYADPLTGSDRYFAEAQRESMLGNAEAAEAAKQLGLARFAEIQAEYPWPDEAATSAS